MPNVPLALLLAVALALPATGAAAPPPTPAAARAGAIASTVPVGTLREAEKAVRASFKTGGKRADLERIAAACVDYEDVARRSAGARWAGFSPADRAAVTKALRALVEETYMSGLFKPDPLFAFAVLGHAVDGGEATVRAIAQSGGRQAPAEFRLVRGKDKRWRIVDVTVNNVAIVAGYREQFQQLLDLGGVPKLVGTLEAQRKALVQMRAAPAAPASR